MQILEGEINLRDETRVAEQSRPAIESDDYEQQAAKLSTTQGDLQKRVEAVTQRLVDLPDGAEEFGPEIKLLGEVWRSPTPARRRSRPRPRSSSCCCRPSAAIRRGAAEAAALRAAAARKIRP